MPAAWEKRYVKTCNDAGLEVALLKKLRNGRWAVLSPAGEVLAMDLGARAGTRTVPVENVAYQPLPVLTEDRKAQI